MNLNKFLVRLTTIFGLAIMFSVSGFGDTPTNDSCLNAELNATFSNLSSSAAGTISGSLTSGSDEQDYYKITVASGGTLQINATSTQTTDFSIGKTCSGTTCGTDIYTNGNTQKTLHNSGLFAVAAGDVVYFKMSRNNKNLTYNISISYQPPVKIGFQNSVYQISEDTASAYGTSSLIPMTITLDRAVSYPVQVNYQTNNGTAIEGWDQDYRMAAQTVEIPAGETALTIYMAIYHDEPIEMDENFTVLLSNPSIGAALDPLKTTSTVTILEQLTAPLCYQDNFDQTLLDGTWRTLKSSGTFTPGIVDNRLRLTPAVGDMATAVTKDFQFASSENIIIVEFNQYAYNGSGADGFAMVLYDTLVGPNPIPGAFGGSLGYAQKSNPGSDCTAVGGCPGFQGGWLGLGLDEYGNYQNPTEGRIGGTSSMPNAVSIRGDGSGQIGYEYLAGTESLTPTLWQSGSTPYSGGKFRMTVDARDSAHLYVTLERDTTGTGNNYQVIINKFDAKEAQYNQSTTPSFVRLALTASTGGSNAIHEIDDIKVWGRCTPYTATPPASVAADFNVVYADHANAALSSGYYYNLPTQIASRADNYKVIGLNVGTEIKKDVNTSVAVELVDADSPGTCAEKTRISDSKIWVTFKNSSAEDFNATVINANILIPDPQAHEKFYQRAARNAKFRISYPQLGMVGPSITQESPAGSGMFRLIDFPGMAGTPCVHPVDTVKLVGNHWQAVNYTQVPQACANAGLPAESAMTQHELNGCMECIYGINNAYVCSRDNFAIRPEAFFVNLKDQNQTMPATKQFLTNNTPSPASLNLASGYNYNVGITATNHLGNTPTLDYNTTEGLDANWMSTFTGCNDENNRTTAFAFLNGSSEGNLSVSQVGEYSLGIIDSVWATVDITPLAVHRPSPANFYLGAGSDCILTSDVTSMVKTAGIGSNPVLNGCNISSDHNNSVANILYKNMNTTFHPYKFDMSSISFGLGTTPSVITGGQEGFVYMSDISDDEGMNMSLRSTGNIRAVGYDNVVTTNFVKDCYAKPLNLSMLTLNNLTHPQGAAFQLRFMDYNTTVASPANLIYDSNATNINTTALLIPLTSILDGNFTKETVGSLYTVSRFNYDRTVTQPLDPIEANFRKMNVNCLNVADCLMQADLSAAHEPKGERAMDFNVTYAYGRIIPRDVRVFGNVDFTANAWYEVFKAPTLAGEPLAPSRNGAQWFVNKLHNDNNDGDGNITRLQNNMTVTTVNIGGNDVNGVEAYDFTAVGTANIPYSRKAHINTDPWLWFGTNAHEYSDPSDANLDCLTHPCFNINVVPNIGTAGSATSTDLRTDKTNKATSTGTGVTYDYTPATR